MIAPEQVFAERFHIERLAGRGGMGAVYRARDLCDGGWVALKVLRDSGDVDGRFGREARVLAQLEHPGIVRHVAHGHSAEGYPYLAMEWLDGEDLAQRLARGALGLTEAIQVVRRASEALAFAHQRGIVHRDIKPSNIYLADLGEERGYSVKLLDFGIARISEGTHFATGTGAMLGTPGYMAPEQARGDRGLGDPGVDVFALGAVLFECITGRRAFDGEHVMAILAKIVFQDAPRLMETIANIPVPVDDLVARMMARAREDRPRDAGEVAVALRDIAPRSASGAPPEPHRATALTRGELRLVSIILSTVERAGARPSCLPSAGESDVTLDTAPRVSPESRLYAVAARFGARLERLLDGSFAAAMTGSGNATDQAAIAARCALAIREELPQARMALATGLAPMHQRLALGETIDRAAKLLSERLSRPPLASGGEPALRPIRLDEATAGLLDTRFEIGGDTSGLELRRERDPVNGRRTLLGKVTRCVGRERELSVLHGLYDECVGEPVARAVLVTAPPGLGKSRLLQEFLDKASARGAPTVLVARGDPMRSGSRFGVLAEALRREMGLLATEAPTVQQQKLRARVGRHVTHDASRVIHFLGELVGVPFADPADVQLRAARADPRLMRDQMCRAWEELVALECEAHPVVLVLEDLQWADAPSIQLVDAALRSASEQPFMVVALARPEVHQVFPQLWAQRGVSEVRLGELTRKASDKLVREVLGDTIDAAGVDRITRQAGGNAFYLEELIRAVADGREGKLPDTVMAMAQARIETLDPDARRLLRAASVFGQTFWLEGVSLLLGRGDGDTPLEESVEALGQSEFLATHQQTRFVGTRELAFCHALVREAVYGTLTEEDRTLGHKLAALWLSGAGESDPAVLAEHFHRGGELVSAAHCYQRASERALEANDVAAALAASTKGIACARATASIEDEVLGRLFLTQATSLVSHGELDDAGRCVEEAIARLTVGQSAWFRAVTELIVLAGRKANVSELRRWIAVSAVDAIDIEAEGARMACWCRGVTALLIAGCFDEAGALRERVEAVAPAVDAGDAGMMAQIHRARAFHHLYAGDLGAAIASFEWAVVALEQASDQRAACLIRCNLGFAHKSIGNYHEAESVLRLALTAAERMGLRDVATAVMHNLGMVLALLGRIEEGRVTESRAVEQCRTQGDPRLEGGSRCYLSAIALLAGDPAAAELEARHAVKLLEVSPPTQVSAHAALAHALLAQDRNEEALAAARDGMSILDALVRVEDGEATLRLAFAEALRRCGSSEEARVAALAAKDRVAARAATIADPKWRRTFLDNVAENARTIALASEYMSPAGRAAAG